MTSLNYFVAKDAYKNKAPKHAAGSFFKGGFGTNAPSLKIISLLLAIVLLALSAFAALNPVFAGSATDEILDYEITVSPLEDASVKLSYHIEWKVLKSDGIGPLEWVSIGLPSDSYIQANGYSANVSGTEFDGSYINVYFADKYYAGEVVRFDFCVIMDDMFEANDEILTFYFRPGWFDDIAVDKILIKWDTNMMQNHSSGGYEDGSYIVWEGSLKSGQKFDEVYASYNMSDFDLSRFEGDSNNQGGNQSGYKQSTSSGVSIILPIIIFVIIFLIIRAKKKKAEEEYDEGAGFDNTKTKSKVTRTKVVYFDECPGCGAPHQDGADVCEYCGRSMIKSEEVLEEDEVKEEDKEAFNYSDNGIFRYGPNPNTFVRVNVVHVPVGNIGGARPGVNHAGSMGQPGGIGQPGGNRAPSGGFGQSAGSRAPGGKGQSSGGHAPSGNSRPLGSSGKSTGRSSGIRSGGSRTGGCVHSSCACACVSCACACACAGGGRAGCSTKDFYKSTLKMEQLRKRKHQR